MRLHSSVSRSRGRLVVLKLGVFVGLLIFLMVATIACDNTEPLLEPASIQESTGTSAPTPTPDGTDVSQSPSPHIDPASREAEGYAAHHGVSLEEAQNRFTLQRLAGELNAVLSDREGRTFAGLWIEHTPQFRVVLLRLPVEHQARQGRLRDSHAQRPPLRGAGGQQDSLQHSH